MRVGRRMALALVLLAAGVLVPATPAPALTVTVGLSPERQCALARPMIKIPIPGEWDLTCHRSTYPGLSWGQTVYTGWDMREVDYMEVHLADPVNLETVAELMAHEVAHGYVAGTSRGGDPHNDWVASHEPYIDHFARCIIRTNVC